ncbi:hypothetical protein BJ944DRAFT_265415 [Cunninghamella echinulata]|nr:hypothetical protein BJ944DRAFT_265415 [Cunninghamella echinulata]
MSLVNVFIRFLLILSLVIHTTCYNVPSDILYQLPAGGGAAYTSHDGYIYSYGGLQKNASGTEVYNGGLYRMSIDPNGPDGGFKYEYLSSYGNASFGQLLLLNDNQTLLTIGNYITTPNRTDKINASMRLYHLSNNTWTAPRIANTTASLPVNRGFLSATVAPNGLVYFLGGNNPDGILIDFFSYNPTTGVFQNLTNNTEVIPYNDFPSYCSSMIAKPDGTIVLLFGVTYDENLNNAYTGTQTVPSYNTNTGEWQLLSNTNYPFGNEGRLCPAVMPNLDKTAVYAFGGGSDFMLAQSKIYNDLLIYNLTTNKWSRPATIGYTPVARIYPIGGFLDSNHLLVTGGSLYSMSGRYIDVLRLPADQTQALQWVSTYNEDVTYQGSSSIDGGKIAAIVVCIIVAMVLIGLFLWRFGKYMKIMILNLHYDIWRPRTGEPLWAETMRVISQIILFFLFIAFAVFIGLQVQYSPVITLTINEPATQVGIPNVRICLEGTPIPTAPGEPQFPIIQCTLPSGELCGPSVFSTLNLTKFSPDYNTGLTILGCSYFNSANSIKISGTSNSSELLFNVYTNATYRAAIHVDLFPHNYDPIENIYFGKENLMPAEEINGWKADDRVGAHVANSYDLLPGQLMYINYQLIDHQYLKKTGWNYMGILPSLNSTPELDSTQHTNTLEMAAQQNLVSQPASYIKIRPEAMITQSLREQKLYSVISALSYMGGLYSVFITLQTLLFGYRPTSPWGLVHRWSIGELKRSISHGLVSRFQTLKTPVPLVNPVHRRFSQLNIKSYGYQNIGPLHGGGDAFDDDDMEKGATEHDPLAQFDNEENRLTRMEDRLQLLELLFKSYYINDEVFKSLDKAIKKDQKRKHDSLSTLSTGYQNAISAPNESLNDDELKDIATPPSSDNNNNKTKKKNWLPNIKTNTNTNTALWEQNKSLNDDHHDDHHHLPRLTTPTRDFNPTTHQSIHQQQDLLDDNGYPNSSSTSHSH